MRKLENERMRKLENEEMSLFEILGEINKLILQIVEG